ncbi:MAG: HipA domain-containing protein [Alphaproteobacteria bacterium]
MKLDVWMERVDFPVGTLMRSDDKTLTFAYSQEAVQRGSPDCRLSIALPLREAAYQDSASVAFFGNLLFEGRRLDDVVDGHGIDRDDYGRLLQYLGADCPGAVSVTPEGTGPGKRPGIFPDDYEELSAETLLKLVRSLHFHGRLPEETRDPSPVAGVQPKIAVVLHEGRYYLPRKDSRAPTTHILKVSPRNDSLLTRHEVALLALAGELGLDVSQAERQVFHDPDTATDIETLLSTRFDRTFLDGRITRLHSEDFCQALGLPKALKYERNAVTADQRFSAAAVGRLAAMVAAPGLFQIRFLEQTLFNLAVGNTDNHAKNSTILYRGDAGELAPLYDVVPITLDPRPTHAFAFNLGEAAYAEDLTEQNLLDAMSDLGFARPRFTGRWPKILAQVAEPGIAMLEASGGKQLADGIAAQLRIVSEALGQDFEIPERDYFPRNRRDARPGEGGGWTVLS